jgi:proline dehydrogenase
VSAVAAVGRRLESRAASGYVSGPELDDALAIARRLHAAGTPCTIGYWDGPGAPASLAAHALVRTLRALEQPADRQAGGGTRLDAVIALKVPAVSGVDGEVAVGMATGVRHRLLVDAPAPISADDALALALALARRGCDAGIALPGRWTRAVVDAEVAVHSDLAVRLVKGEWPDPRDPDRPAVGGVLELVDQLAGRARHVGVASHDPEVVGPALRRLVAAGTSCELEVLLGLPTKPVVAVARELGVRVRAYIPWGTSVWVPYDATAARRSPRLARRLLGDVTLGRRRWARTLAVSG